jgi:hypothetical protein
MLARLAVTIQYPLSRRVINPVQEADLEEVTGLVAADDTVIAITKASGIDFMTGLAAPALRTGEGVGRGVRLGVDTGAAEEMQSRTVLHIGRPLRTKRIITSNPPPHLHVPVWMSSGVKSGRRPMTTGV